MKKYTPLALFQEGSDLPLWTGYNPAPEPKQQSKAIDFGYTQTSLIVPACPHHLQWTESRIIGDKVFTGCHKCGAMTEGWAFIKENAQ